MSDALSMVLSETDGGSSEVKWTDVRGELSSGQWGRMIETGVLVDGDAGFRLSDVEAVQDAVEGGTTSSSTPTTTTADDDEDEDTGWTTWDKVAAVAAIALFTGYSQTPVRNAVGHVVNVVLGPIDTLLPFYVVILLLSVVTGLYSTLLQANLMDMDKMSRIQQRNQAIQERRKEAKEAGDEEELERIQEEQMEAMGDQMGMFKAQMRPMVWIMLLTIPAFLWMYWKLLGEHIVPSEMHIVMPLVGQVQWHSHVIGPIQAWIAWYFLCSMGFTQVIRKALNIQTTPT